MAESNQGKRVAITLLFFFIADLCEIAGGYLVWLWLRDGMSWILGALGGFALFLYGVVPTFQPSHFHRIYAAYGGIFIVMAVIWGWTFEGFAPDRFDIIGAVIALAGVAIIFYMPRKGEEKSIGRSRSNNTSSSSSSCHSGAVLCVAAIAEIGEAIWYGYGYEKRKLLHWALWVESSSLSMR